MSRRTVEVLDSRGSHGDNGNPRSSFGTGPLSRFAALVYTLLVVNVLTLVAALPGLVPLALLGRDASNLTLVALCLVPLGPALSAAVYAVRHRSSDATDLAPAAAFARGYRANLRSVLAIWLPLLAWLGIVAVSLANFGATGLPGWWAVLLAAIALAATLWGVNALVITSLFAFRTRDVARLSAYFLFRTPGMTLGNACLLIVAGGLAVLFSEVVLGLLASVFVLSLVRTSAPMRAVLRAEFVA